MKAAVRFRNTIFTHEFHVEALKNALERFNVTADDVTDDEVEYGHVYDNDEFVSLGRANREYYLQDRRTTTAA